MKWFLAGLAQNGSIPDICPHDGHPDEVFCLELWCWEGRWERGFGGEGQHGEPLLGKAHGGGKLLALRMVC